MHSRDHADFTVPRLLRNPHLQTLGAALPLYSPPRTLGDVEAEAMRLPIPGGALHAHAWWHARQGEQQRERLAVVLMHGLGGSSESKYLVRAAVALYRAGYHVVRLNVRGAGASIADAPLLYHAGLTEDPRVAVDLVSRMPRVRGVAIVAFSLGGNTALKLAGEWRDAPPREVRGIATISAPLDLDTVGRAMERVRTLPYRAYVLRAMVRQGQAFARLRPERVKYDARALPKLRTIRAYDEVVIAPMHGFACARDYYAQESAGPRLQDVRVPTLIVHAGDDPMVPGESVLPWLRRASPSIEVAWSRRGGHVGWFAGVTEARWVNTWAVDRVLAFLRRVA